MLALALPTVLRSRPLNVVALYADDWRNDTLGFAGHSVVKTPQQAGDKPQDFGKRRRRAGE